MFKFNFHNSGDSKPEDEDQSICNKLEDKKNVLEWLPATEVFQPAHFDVNDKHINYFICGTYQIQHVDASQICNANDKGISEAESQHSDLLPAKYEGGLKIWECTHNLAHHFLKEGVNLHSKRVLDLGCGAGILGILAMQLGAAIVHFQDYNVSVLTCVTIPNVLLNSPKLQQETSTRFFSGDWESFMHLLSEKCAANEEKYDYILTSETIYNSDNHIKLLNVFKQCLNVDGTVYLAAKTYYFGVGGGIRQFERLLSEDGTLQSHVSWKCSEGVQREILKIQFNM